MLAFLPKMLCELLREQVEFVGPARKGKLRHGEPSQEASQSGFVFCAGALTEGGQAGAFSWC